MHLDREAQLLENEKLAVEKEIQLKAQTVERVILELEQRMQELQHKQDMLEVEYQIIIEQKEEALRRREN